MGKAIAATARARATVGGTLLITSNMVRSARAAYETFCTAHELMYYYQKCQKIVKSNHHPAGSCQKMIRSARAGCRDLLQAEV